MEQAYIVIAATSTTIIETMEERLIYDDQTERFIKNIDLATSYRDYLANKFPKSKIVLSAIPILEDGELDILELKRQDALSKLTMEDINILNLNQE